MKLLSNYDFNNIVTSDAAFLAIEREVSFLIQAVDECNDTFTDSNVDAFVTNIKWVKRFYEAAERCVINDL